MRLHLAVKTCPPPKIREKYFSAIYYFCVFLSFVFLSSVLYIGFSVYCYHVYWWNKERERKFGHFSGKYHKNSGILIIFIHIFRAYFEIRNLKFWGRDIACSHSGIEEGTLPTPHTPHVPWFDRMRGTRPPAPAPSCFWTIRALAQRFRSSLTAWRFSLLGVYTSASTIVIFSCRR